MPTDLKSTLYSNQTIMEFGTGKAFTSVSTWEAALPSNVTTGIEEANISGLTPGFVLGESLTFTGSGASATCVGVNAAGTKIWYHTVLSFVPAAGDVISGATGVATLDSVASTSTGVSCILNCFAGEYNQIFTISGTTTSNEQYSVAVRAAPGQAVNRTATSGVRFAHLSRNDLAIIITANVQLEQLGFKLAYDNPNDRQICDLAAGAINSYVVRCVFYDSINTHSTGGNDLTAMLTSETAGNSLGYVNCAAFNVSGRGGFIIRTAHLMFNCTIVDTGKQGSSFGIDVTNEPHVKNCIATLNDDGTTVDYDDSGASTNTVSLITGDATAEGTGAIPSANLTFIGGTDYGLSSSSVDGPGDGTDLSANAKFDFDLDFEGNTRSTWDCGFFTQAAAGGTVLPQMMAHNHFSGGA